MTAIAVAVVVCAASLAALVLVLRFLERREARIVERVTKTVEAELRDALKSAEMRISKLEMARAIR